MYMYACMHAGIYRWLVWHTHRSVATVSTVEPVAVVPLLHPPTRIQGYMCVYNTVMYAHIYQMYHMPTWGIRGAKKKIRYYTPI